MAPLPNSRRQIERATYVPLVREVDSDAPVSRTLEKYSFLTSLGVTKAEISALRQEVDGERGFLLALDAVNASLDRPGVEGRRRAMVLLAEVDPDHLVAFGQRVEQLRRDTGRELAESLVNVADRARVAAVAPPAAQRSGPDAELAARVGRLVELAGGQTHDPLADPEIGGWQAHAECRAAAAGVLTGAFTEQMKVEPIGRLHLERLELVPAAIHRGELVYSLALAPREERRVTHREWSIRTEEFEQVVEEQSEELAEQSVNEKRELATSIESQSRRQTAFALSASYSGITVSGSASAQASSEDTDSERESRTESMDLTRKASSRSRRDHKVSFRATTQVGTETEEQHLLTNPSESDAMRLDYFRLLREWQVNLYRYGLRLTYDIVIPHPGLRMLDIAADLHRTQLELAKPFTFDIPFDLVSEASYQELTRRFGITVPEPPETPLTLVETPTFETAGDTTIFEAINFDVDPDYVVSRAQVRCRFAWASVNPNPQMADLYFDVVGQPGPPLRGFAAQGDPNDGHLHLDEDIPHLIGRSGEVPVIVARRELGPGTVEATLELTRQPEALERWRNQTWLALREAALEQWTLERQLLLDRLERLNAEIGSYDALTLRKMEREAIMRGVLQWLFGPGFETGIEGDCVAPSDDGVDLVDPATWSQWLRVAQYGELIRFLQQAVEWENVIYLGYPYFWDTPANWEVKENLRHPDFRHQEFLRAGFFRVVLTVRPGYEHDLIALTETGVLADAANSLPSSHPYLRIADELQATAERLYPPPPAEGDTDEAENTDRGTLIGHWREYTPVSGLDIAVNTNLATIA